MPVQQVPAPEIGLRTESALDSYDKVDNIVRNKITLAQESWAKVEQEMRRRLEDADKMVARERERSDKQEKAYQAQDQFLKTMLDAEKTARERVQRERDEFQREAGELKLQLRTNEEGQRIIQQKMAAMEEQEQEKKNQMEELVAEMRAAKTRAEEEIARRELAEKERDTARNELSLLRSAIGIKAADFVASHAQQPGNEQE
jgi:hypothetical protein